MSIFQGEFGIQFVLQAACTTARRSSSSCVAEARRLEFDRTLLAKLKKDYVATIRFLSDELIPRLA